MSKLVDLLSTTPPNTAKANTKGVDFTPIGDGSGRPEFKPSQNLAKNEERLKIAREGELGSNPSPGWVGGYTPSKPYTSKTERI